MNFNKLYLKFLIRSQLVLKLAFDWAMDIYFDLNVVFDYLWRVWHQNDPKFDYLDIFWRFFVVVVHEKDNMSRLLTDVHI